MYIIEFEPGHDFFDEGEIVGRIPDLEIIKEFRYKNEGKAYAMIDDASAKLEMEARDKKSKVN